MDREQKTLEIIEIEALTDVIFKHYGYDIRNYAQASLSRRIKHFMLKNSIEYVSSMIPLILHNKSQFKAFLYDLSIPVTEMFRDSGFFTYLRTDIMDYLRTYPALKIWHAGCATGEEVYSMAILLKEANIYKKSTIYATDFNDVAISQAREGIFPIDRVKEYTVSYQNSGGKHSFGDYYRSDNKNITLDKELGKKITWANHNLATDGVFTEVQLVMCRNVLIYFNRELQNRVLELFTDSLVPGGILALGSKETLRYSSVFDKYETLSEKWKVYKKKYDDYGKKSK